MKDWTKELRQKEEERGMFFLEKVIYRAPKWVQMIYTSTAIAVFTAVAFKVLDMGLQ